MKKLNNKGFAISTMLYGILTMIVLVLMLLLSIMRSSYNKQNTIGDDISYYLNKCIARQVALENCVKTYNADPDHLVSCYDEFEGYSSCLDSDVTLAATAGQSENLENLIIDNADNGNTGLVKDGDKRYIFVGTNANNYIRIGTKNGRIMAIENGSAKVILEDVVVGAFDKVAASGSVGEENRFLKSTLYNSLRLKYNAMDYTSKFVKGKFSTGSYNNIGGKIDSQYMTANFAIPSLTDYIKASSKIKSTGSDKCDLNNINGTINNCAVDNWMTTYSKGGGSSCHWTLTPNSSLNSYVTYGSKINISTSYSEVCDANMVIYLNNKAKANISGIGTLDKPYILDVR